MTKPVLRPQAGYLSRITFHVSRVVPYHLITTGKYNLFAVSTGKLASAV
jgi:hypothetical protein